MKEYIQKATNFLTFFRFFLAVSEARRHSNNVKTLETWFEALQERYARKAQKEYDKAMALKTRLNPPWSELAQKVEKTVYMSILLSAIKKF